MAMSCSKGQKGRFKASGLEFEIIETTPTTSTIHFHLSRIDEKAEVLDEELKKVADSISDWGVKPRG